MSITLRTFGASQDDSLSAEPDRRPTDPMAAGLCAALSDRYGISILALRAMFVVLSVAGGFGIVAYLGAVMAARQHLDLRSAWEPSTDPELSPKERAVAAPRPPADLGIALVTFGVLWELRSWWPGYRSELVIPIALVALGLVIGWRGSERSGLDSLLGSDATPGRRMSNLTLRIGAGLILLLVAVVAIAGESMSWATLRDSAIAIGIAGAGLALVAAPPLARLATSMNDERSRRIREQERSDLASHLHDSVLQTLTLIQRQSEDSTRVATLARRQERELRRWLFGGMDGDLLQPSHDRWGPELQRMLDEVEDRHEIGIESIIVGDAPMNEALVAVIGATREALVNAAKFSGEQRVSVFAEVDGAKVSVFVRDRGVGFDPLSIPEDRRGVSDSIVRRVRHHGGNATVRSALGEGCEVELTMDLAGKPTVSPNGGR